MSGIIQDAKKLLEGTTPGPWLLGGKDESGNIYIGNPSEYGNLVATSGIGDAELIAAAPELAQALAEETWEYGVEYKYLTNRGAEWRLDPDVGWHKTYRDAERAASASVQYRIVRRRVSPPEVINE